jgi:hypothetical protein
MWPSAAAIAPLHETRKLCDGNHLRKELYVVSRESVNGAHFGLCMTWNAPAGAELTRMAPMLSVPACSRDRGILHSRRDWPVQ